MLVPYVTLLLIIDHQLPLLGMHLLYLGPLGDETPHTSNRSSTNY